MEGIAHEVPIAVAKMSKLVESTIDDDEDDDDEDDNVDNNDNAVKRYKDIPLPKVKDAILTNVIEYCKYHTLEEAMTDIETPLKSTKLEDLVQKWYYEFFQQLQNKDEHLIYDLVEAANYMDIKPLLDVACLAVSIHLKSKPKAEVCKIFGMTEEEADAEEKPAVAADADADAVA